MPGEEGLHDAGRRILLHIMVDLVEGGILWAFHAIISVSAIIARKSPRFTKNSTAGSTNFFLIVLTTLLGMSTAFFCISVTQVVNALRYGLIETQSDSEFDLERWGYVIYLNNQLQLPSSWLNAPGGIMYLIGDAVFVWRAFIICPGRRIPLVLATLLVLASLALSITMNILHVLYVTRPGASPYTDSLWGLLTATALFSSLVANGLATGSIGYDVYRYRKSNRELMGSPRSGAVQVLAYLTEAGVMYFFLQVGLIVTYFLRVVNFSPLDYLYRLWACFALYYSITTPSIIVLLLVYNKSFTDFRTQRSTHISFARPATTVDGGDEEVLVVDNLPHTPSSATQ